MPKYLGVFLCLISSMAQAKSCKDFQIAGNWRFKGLKRDKVELIIPKGSHKEVQTSAFINNRECKLKAFIDKTGPCFGYVSFAPIKLKDNLYKDCEVYFEQTYIALKNKQGLKLCLNLEEKNCFHLTKE